MKKFKSYFVLSFIAILSLICSSCTIEKDEEFNNSSSISVDGNKYFILLLSGKPFPHIKVKG